MSQDLILPRARNELASTLEKSAALLRPLVNSRELDVQQFLSAAIVAANELSKPQECEPNSVLVAAAHCAMIGLLPGRALGLAYFVPRRPQKGAPRARVQLELSYQGYINLATRNDYLKWVYADLVLKNEDFVCGVQDCAPSLTHTVPRNRVLTAQLVRDRLEGAYCCWETVSGGRSHHYVPRSKIDEVAKSGGPIWRGQYYPEMVRKTPIRLAAKMWRTTRELAMAVHLEDQAEIGEPQDLGLQLEAPAAEQDVRLADFEEIEE